MCFRAGLTNLNVPFDGVRRIVPHCSLAGARWTRGALKLLLGIGHDEISTVQPKNEAPNTVWNILLAYGN